MRKIFKQSKRHYRNNLTRKNKTKKVNKHPSLVVGEKGNAFINIGLTHSKKEDITKILKFMIQQILGIKAIYVMM